MLQAPSVVSLSGAQCPNSDAYLMMCWRYVYPEADGYVLAIDKSVTRTRGCIDSEVEDRRIEPEIPDCLMKIGIWKSVHQPVAFFETPPASCH